jgi:putative membrane protein
VMWGWGAGWWLVGAVFMVICMVMMGRMMGGMMMGHGHSAQSGHGHDGNEEPERTLADRLAKGEIDVEEYNRLLETLRRTNNSARA